MSRNTVAHLGWQACMRVVSAQVRAGQLQLALLRGMARRASHSSPVRSGTQRLTKPAAQATLLTTHAVTTFSRRARWSGRARSRRQVVMPFRPVVACNSLPKDEDVWSEELAKGAKGARADAVHGPWLEVHQNGMRHVAASSCCVEVLIDSFRLQIGIAVVRPGGVDATTEHNGLDAV